MRVLLVITPSARLEPLTLTRLPAALPLLNRSLLGHLLDALAGLRADVHLCTTKPWVASLERLSAKERSPGLPVHSGADSPQQLLEAAAAVAAGDGLLLLDGNAWIGADDLGALAAAPALATGYARAPTGFGAFISPEGDERMLCGLHLTPGGLEALAANTPGNSDGCLPQAAATAGLLDGKRLHFDSYRPPTYPWTLIEMNVEALSALEGQEIDGDVAPGVTIDGPVRIGAGTRVKAGTTIEGPVVIGRDCTIGPCAYLRPNTVIGDNGFVGHGFEVYDSVILNGFMGKHRGYIGHSVIGENVNAGCGLITSDYRHDAGTHVTRIAGRRVLSGRVKLGAFIGDGVHTGVHTTIYPGRKIWPGLGTRPGEWVSEDRTA